MKQLYTFLCISVFTLSLPNWVFCHGISQQLERQVQQIVDENRPSLFSVVMQDLQTYYGRTDFTDKHHTTGWYRVDDFLKWIQENSDSLDKQELWYLSKYDSGTYLRSIYTHPQFTRDLQWRQQFWIYLGVLYALDIYQIQKPHGLRTLEINVTEKNNLFLFGGEGNARHQMFGNGPAITVPLAKDFLDIPAWINTGMHEGTHLIPYFIDGSHQSLNELATFYSQYNYGLPVKAKQATAPYAGIRDIRRIHQLRPDFPLLNEYTLFVTRILLNDSLRPRRLIRTQELQSHETSSLKNAPVIATLLNLIALQDQSFFFYKKHKGTISFEGPEMLKLWRKDLSKEERQQLLESRQEIYLGTVDPFYPKKSPSHYFAVYAPTYRYKDNYDEEECTPITQEDYLRILYDRMLNQNVKNFYRALLRNIPATFIQEVKRKYPLQTYRTFEPGTQRMTMAYETLIAPHTKELITAILRALEESGAPPVPPIPDGYL